MKACEFIANKKPLTSSFSAAHNYATKEEELDLFAFVVSKIMKKK